MWRQVVMGAVLAVTFIASAPAVAGSGQHDKWVAETLPEAYRAIRACLAENANSGALRVTWLTPAQEEVWAVLVAADGGGLEIESSVWAGAGDGSNVTLVDDNGDGVVNAAGWTGQPLQRGPAVEESEAAQMTFHTVVYIATEQNRCVAERMGLGG